MATIFAGQYGSFLCEVILVHSESSFGCSPLAAVDPILDKNEVADLLSVPATWVAAHADVIPGMFRLGRYLRFRRAAIEEWLGSFAPVLKPEETAMLLRVPTSWVYSHADEIPGVLRLGYYVRFRHSVIQAFVGGSETCQ
jgi:predicted DNA-binding transcriptional regulator AlpA